MHVRDVVAGGDKRNDKFFSPPAVPDDQNFLKAPPLETWFRKGSTDTKALALMPRLPGGLKYIPPSMTELKDWEHMASSIQPGSEFPAGDQSIIPAAALLKWFEQYDTGLRALFRAASRTRAPFDPPSTR